MRAACRWKFQVYILNILEPGAATKNTTIGPLAGIKLADRNFHLQYKTSSIFFRKRNYYTGQTLSEHQVHSASAYCIHARHVDCDLHLFSCALISIK
jgi:hypothetical protein